MKRDDQVSAAECAKRARAVSGELQLYAPLSAVVRSQLADVNEQTGKNALKVAQRLQAIDEGVAAIIAAAGTLVNESESILEPVNAESGETIEQNDMTARLSAVVRLQAQMLAEVQAQSRTVADGVAELLAALQVHDVTRQQVEHVLGTLLEVDWQNERLSRALLTPDPTSRVPAFAPVLERLYATYIMHLQRPGHTPVALPEDPDVDIQAPRIEFF